MSTGNSILEVEYPYSDGEPMGESDLHRDLMFDVIELLRQRYAGENVYISGNQFLYYREGHPKKVVCPDAMVVFDCSPKQRKSFKIWEEDRIPSVVFEVTSDNTKSTDINSKPGVYKEVGVAEYFMYDPTGDYLTPSLCGFRLDGSEYRRIEPESDGSITSQTLGVRLYLMSGVLTVDDAKTGATQLTRLEASNVSRDRERVQRELAESERDKERSARLAAEAELERLRKLLDSDAT